MRILMTGVYDFDTADAIVRCLREQPMTMAQLDAHLNMKCEHTIRKLSQCGAIKLLRGKKCIWVPTNISYRKICCSCSHSEVVWRIDETGMCHKCRPFDGKPSAIKEDMFRDFEAAKPFNLLLQLPFGLESERYMQCLQAR